MTAKNCETCSGLKALVLLLGLLVSGRYDGFCPEEDAMKICVGSLSFDVTDADLRQAFEAFGQVASATVIMDKFGTLSRGFGFVEMPDKSQAQAAMMGLNGQDFKGRRLAVNDAGPSTGADRGQGRSGGRKPSRSR